ncbi:MAG: hypothetical protein HC840_04975 [Leptolyngbyaceae cyanobacterium RM2_2_4]|nr:hypothetical protein [Leptolyngbyaceae cyanobacterium RM2_2_4]
MTNIPSFVPNGFEIVTIRKDIDATGQSFFLFGSFSNLVILGASLTISEPLVIGGANMLLFGTSLNPASLCQTANLLPQRAFKTITPTLIAAETYFVYPGLNGVFVNAAIFGSKIIAELTFMRAR